MMVSFERTTSPDYTAPPSTEGDAMAKADVVRSAAPNVNIGPSTDI
jgi:hypothetical protein